MKDRSTVIQLVAFCLTFILGSSVAFGQGLARISGTVTDSTKAAIPDATVVATRISTGEKSSVTSNGEGEYVFPSLAPAEFSVGVTANGFTGFLQTGVVLQADQAITVNVTLNIGSSTQTVNVDAAPPQVDTTTGTLSQVIDQKRVNDLPLNGRNAAALTTLVPGVVVAPSTNIDQGQTKTFPVVASVTVNGTRANQVNYMLDGGTTSTSTPTSMHPSPCPMPCRSSASKPVTTTQSTARMLVRL